VPGQVVRPLVLDAGERPLVLEDERLVAGVELHAFECAVVYPAGAHEPHRTVDLVRHVLVAGAGLGRPRECGVPRVDAIERGQSATGVGAQQVQRGGRGGVRTQDAVRVRGALTGQVVDHVAAVGRAAGRVHSGRSRLGVLPGDAAELD